MAPVLAFDIETVPEDEVKVRLRPIAFTNTELDIEPQAESRYAMTCDLEPQFRLLVLSLGFLELPGGDQFFLHHRFLAFHFLFQVVEFYPRELGLPGRIGQFYRCGVRTNLQQWLTGFDIRARIRKNALYDTGDFRFH